MEPNATTSNPTFFIDIFIGNQDGLLKKSTSCVMASHLSLRCAHFGRLAAGPAGCLACNEEPTGREARLGDAAEGLRTMQLGDVPECSLCGADMLPAI